MIHDLTTQEGRNAYVEAMSKKTPQNVKDHNAEVVETLGKMLTNDQIAEHLLNDLNAYRENIKDIIVGRLMDSSRQRVYWDAWFRGAEGKDLEDADKGVIYKG